MSAKGSSRVDDEASNTRFVKIYSLDQKARGLAKVSTSRGEKTYKIPHTFPGELIEVFGRKSKRKHKKSLNKVNRIIRSPWTKLVPFCSVYHICGGCNMQELSYEDQLRIKELTVDRVLLPLVTAHPGHMKRPIIASKAKYYYRNRIDYSFGAFRWIEEREQEIQDKRALGLHVSGFFDKVVSIQHCYIHESNTLRREIHQWCVEHSLQYYNSREKKGVFRTLTIRNTQEGEYMLIISVTERNAALYELIQFIREHFSNVKSIYSSLNCSSHESILKGDLCHEYGEKYIVESCGHIRLQIYPSVFYQTNSSMAPVLYQTLVDMAEFGPEEKVLDLYCGIGSIGLFIADKVEWVCGLELENSSILLAKENALLNNIQNISVMQGAVEDSLKDILQDEHRFDTCILDPPRAGLHPRALKELIEYAPKKILYVSCNPSSLARDLAEFGDTYRIISWQAVDMFPHTHHIECVVRLDRI